jgi:Zn-dependent protease
LGGLSDPGYAAMGMAVAVLFFASSLLRELGHALAARREGISTHAITLWMVGGVRHAGGALAGPEERRAWPSQAKRCRRCSARRWLAPVRSAGC